MSLDAALCFQPGRGWYLAPSPDLTAVVRQQQTPPRFLQEDTMTVAADLGRCTWASCREPATTSSEEGWSFCEEHSVKDTELKAEQDRIITRPAGQPIPRPAPPATLSVVPASADAAIPYASLLNTARAHSVARVRNLADRIGKQLHDLEELIAEHQAAEAARAAEKAAKDKARAEVARLEQQLAAAKAKLRGNAPTARPAAATSPASGEYVCSRGCGKTFNNPQGRGKHSATCTGAAS